MNPAPGLQLTCVCDFWLHDKCTLGAECKYEHPPMLESRLFGTKGDFSLSNEVEEACLHCLQNGRVCDKLGRDQGPEDPCSECRHYAGNAAKCVLDADTSYNDAAWHMMLSRRPDHTLPEPIAREKIQGGKPMPADSVKEGWSGKSKEELLTGPESTIPDFVRQCPRAYLVPARETHYDATASSPARAVCVNMWLAEVDEEEEEIIRAMMLDMDRGDDLEPDE